MLNLLFQKYIVDEKTNDVNIKIKLFSQGLELSYDLENDLNKFYNRHEIIYNSFYSHRFDIHEAYKDKCANIICIDSEYNIKYGCLIELINYKNDQFTTC